MLLGGFERVNRVVGVSPGDSQLRRVPQVLILAFPDSGGLLQDIRLIKCQGFPGVSPVFTFALRAISSNSSVWATMRVLLCLTSALSAWISLLCWHHLMTATKNLRYFHGVSVRCKCSSKHPDFISLEKESEYFVLYVGISSVKHWWNTHSSSSPSCARPCRCWR